MTLSNRKHPHNAGVNADQSVINSHTDLRGNPLEPNEYDPIQLRYEMGWTLERLAEEMGYSASSTLCWSSGHRSPGRLARQRAFEARQKHLLRSQFNSAQPSHQQLIAGWKLLEQMGLTAHIDLLLSKF